MTEEEILNIVIGLIEACDANLVEPGMLNQLEIPESKHGIVLELRNIIERILSEYNYLESPQFQSCLVGKSHRFQAMKRKLEDEPVKCTEHRQDLLAALAVIMTSSDVYNLLPKDQHSLLDRIRILVNGLSDRPLV